MNRFKQFSKNKITPLALATSVLLTTLSGVDTSVVLADEQPVIASDIQVGTAVRNLSLTPGGTVNQMRFTWHSGSTEGSIRIWPQGSPEAYQLLETANVRPVEVHEGNENMGTRHVVPTRSGYAYFLHQTAAYELTPHTVYEYVVMTADGVSEVKSFRTGGTDHFQFGLGGDPQIGVGGQSLEADGLGWINTLEVVTRDFDLDFFVSVGDQVQTMNNSAVTSQMRHDQLFSAPQLTSLPLVPVVGNHDGSGANNTNSRMWPFHYNLPMASHTVRRFADQFYTQFDYYFIWGDVLFIVLDSNTRTQFAGNGPRLQFVEDAMNRHSDANWVVAMFHHATYPVYRDYETNVAIRELVHQWTPELERLGVDVVLNGHEHIYSRSHHMLNNTPQRDQQWLNAAAEVVNDPTGLNYNAVLDPTGLVHISINTSSGSGYRGVRRFPRPYVAIYNQNWRRNVSVATVTPYKFSIATYQINDDSTRTLVDIYTIVRSDDQGQVPAHLTYLRQSQDEIFERLYTELTAITGLPIGTDATVEGLTLPKQVIIETDVRNNDFLRSGNIATNRSIDSADFSSHVVPLWASVEWDLANLAYDPTLETAQTFDVQGVITLPTTVSNTNNLDLTVTVSVTVAGEAIDVPDDEDNIELPDDGEDLPISYLIARFNELARPSDIAGFEPLYDATDFTPESWDIFYEALRGAFELIARYANVPTQTMNIRGYYERLNDAHAHLVRVEAPTPPGAAPIFPALPSLPPIPDLPELLPVPSLPRIPSLPTLPVLPVLPSISRFSLR
ncbi:MAG: metallophosphoesterase [Defluviitaleaceae bacterium]|nr:metallophosphoesterase [Defluviitaleaceae bacterium]